MQQIDDFINELRDFVQVTDYMNFFSQNLDYYELLIFPISAAININYIELMESYFGINQGKYNIFIAPLSRASYGPCLKINGKKYLYNICGTNNKDRGYTNSFEMIHTTWHEFSHSFINPISERSQNLVNKYSYCYEKIKPYTKKGGMGINGKNVLMNI